MLTETIDSGSATSRGDPAVMTAQWMTASTGPAARQVSVRDDGAIDHCEASGKGGEIAHRTGGQRDPVQPDHILSGCQKVFHDVQRDEPGGAGDQYCHDRNYNAGRLTAQACLSIALS
jgi:microcystin degradation protein MlrC